MSTAAGSPGRVALVINQSSGAERGFSGDAIIDDVRKSCADRGDTFLGAYSTSDDFDATIRDALAEKPDLLVVAGGDGTVTGTAEHIHEAGLSGDVTLGIIPTGTVNLLARELAGNSNAQPTVANTLAGKRVPFDYAAVNGRCMLCNTMIGFPAKISQRREHYRGKFSPRNAWRFVRGVIRCLLRDRPFRATIEASGARITRWTRFIAIVHNDVDTPPLGLPRRTAFDRGILTVFVLKSVSPITYLRVIPTLFSGRWQDTGLFDTVSDSRMRIAIPERSRRVCLIRDGELQPAPYELAASIEPQKLAFLAPRETAG